jgi:hypothetical protein
MLAQFIRRGKSALSESSGQIVLRNCGYSNGGLSAVADSPLRENRMTPLWSVKKLRIPVVLRCMGSAVTV